MPRSPRCVAAGQPHHVIQRGNNRQSMFRETHDYEFFLKCVATAIDRHPCAVHAYVLMTNHVHLLVTPAANDHLARVMQSVGRRYVRYFNWRHVRTGTLLEGRYRATLVDSAAYLLTCYPYIDLNPVRAGLVMDPGDYRWSSFGANSWGRADRLVTSHSLYDALGTDAWTRQAAYRALCRSALDETRLRAIRAATNTGQRLEDGGPQRPLRPPPSRPHGGARRGAGRRPNSS